MKRVLITGMSGTGKSTVIAELARRGHRAIDTDWDPDWEAPDPASDGPGWLWREDRIQTLLDADDTDVLFVSACVENQGKFYDRFEHIVLLSVSDVVTRERLSSRTSNPYGGSPAEVDQVLEFKRTVEPLLRRTATVEVDTSAPVDAVVERILGLVD